MRLPASMLALGVMWMILGSGVAAADPPGPTEYRSEVVAIDPDVPGIAVEIVGGDSFVLLTVERGVRVDVVGYAGEPYLRFWVDGTVEENRRSPSKYLNEDRYAADAIPDVADADAPPDWVEVASNGSFAWHDHRTHWMNEVPPPGSGPGDQVTEGVVPLLVDGSEVDVTVISTWQQPPSAAPVALGFTFGLLLAFLALRRRRALVGLVTTLSLAAAVTGGIAYLSVPAETAPPWSLWVLPVTATLLAMSVLFGSGRVEAVARHRWSLLLIATLEVAGWGVAHWGWLWPAVLPTALPFWLDRFVASAVLVASFGAAAAIVGAAAAPRPELG